MPTPTWTMRRRRRLSTIMVLVVVVVVVLVTMTLAPTAHAQAAKKTRRSPTVDQMHEQLNVHRNKCPDPLPVSATHNDEPDQSHGPMSRAFDASWAATMAGDIKSIKVWQHGGQQVKWLATFVDGRQALIKPVSGWKHNMMFEVASFHIDRLLGLYRAPFVVFRPISRARLLGAIKPGKRYTGFKEHFETAHGSTFKEKAEKDMSTYVDEATGEVMVISEWLALLPRDRVDAGWTHQSPGETADLFTFDHLTHNLRTKRNQFGFQGQQIYLDNHGALARPLNKSSILAQGKYCLFTQSTVNKLHHVAASVASSPYCSLGQQYFHRIITVNPFPFPPVLRHALERYVLSLDTYFHEWFALLQQCQAKSDTGSVVVPNLASEFTSAKRQRYETEYHQRMLSHVVVVVRACSVSEGGGGGGDGDGDGDGDDASTSSACESGDEGIAALLETAAATRGLPTLVTGVHGAAPLTTAALAEAGCATGNNFRACTMARLIVTHLGGADNVSPVQSFNDVGRLAQSLSSSSTTTKPSSRLYVTVLRQPIHRAVREWKRRRARSAAGTPSTLAEYCKRPSTTNAYTRLLSSQTSPHNGRAMNVLEWPPAKDADRKGNHFHVALVAERLPLSVALVAHKTGLTLAEVTSDAVIALLLADAEWNASPAELLECMTAGGDGWVGDVGVYQTALDALQRHADHVGPELYRMVEALNARGLSASTSAL